MQSIDDDVMSEKDVAKDNEWRLCVLRAAEQ